MLSPILEALGASELIKKPNLGWELLELVFKAINSAVRKNPSCKDYFKERAATINSITELRTLAEDLERGVDFGDEDVNMDSYE